MRAILRSVAGRGERREREDIEGRSFNLDAEQSLPRDFLEELTALERALNYLIQVRDASLRRASVLQRRLSFVRLTPADPFFSAPPNV